jgi:predicted RNA-binding Zn ribbon-like protein
MKFDSHVLRLLEASVGLCNLLVPGERHGRDYRPPDGAERRRGIAVVVTPEREPVPSVGEQQEVALSSVAARLASVFAAADAGDQAAAAAAVNLLLSESGARPQLDHDPVDGWHVHFHGADDSLVVGWTAGCATALALALGSDLAGRLGVCAAQHCDRVYVDTSRNAARRFCSTACQNRTKAAAFRARGRAARPR